MESIDAEINRVDLDLVQSFCGELDGTLHIKPGSIRPFEPFAVYYYFECENGNIKFLFKRVVRDIFNDGFWYKKIEYYSCI